MRRFVWMALALALAGGSVAQAQTCCDNECCNGDCCDPWHSDDYIGRCVRDFERNYSWPEPFIYPDRAAVYAPFKAMVSKGWQVQNTLSDYHFAPGGQVLTEAGARKVHWILTQAPPSQRRVFVERGLTADQTASRMDAVRGYAARQLPPDIEPPVFPTSIPASRYPAGRIKADMERYEGGRPQPILPEARTDEGAG